jgi:hypothetical protein
LLFESGTEPRLAMALSLVRIGYRVVYCDTRLEDLGNFGALNRSVHASLPKHERSLAGNWPIALPTVMTEFI